MSNATDTPRKTGQRRRRRSRSGRNRNPNNPNQNSSNRSQGSSQQGSATQAKGSGRSRSGRRPDRGRKPVKLTFWQKLLKAIGLYKEPVRSKRTSAKTTEGPKDKAGPSPEAKAARAPKSNTRNARGRQTEEPRSGGRQNSRRRGGDPSTVESSRVYVGNLSYDVTEEDLKELFKGVGTVRHVEIVYNRNTHRSKGYGFLEMMNKEDAMRAVEVLHDQPFMGRNMTVSGAKNKTDEDDEDLEPTMEIKASDVELAPLPEKASEPAQEIASQEPVSAEPAIAEVPGSEVEVEAEAEVAAEAATEAAPEITAEQDEEPKQA